MNAIFNLQKATEAASANGDAFKSVFDVSLKAAQDAFALNEAFLRSFASTDEAPSAFDFERSLGAQTERMERTSAYLSEMGELCVRTQSEIGRLNAEHFEKSVRTMFAQFGNAFDPAGAAGSPVVAEMLRAYTSSAGSAFENMLGAAREITESSLSAATEVLQRNQLAQHKPPRAVKKAA